MSSLNLDRIEAILRLLQQQPHVGELSVEGDGWRVQARSGASVPLPVPPPALGVRIPAARTPLDHHLAQ